MIWQRFIAAVLAFCLGACCAHAQSRPLNDTGIYFSGDASNNSGVCEAAASTTQDCHNGRDAAAAAGALAKTGASSLNNGGWANGFDYSKISNAGNVLPASAVRGSGANDWGCTRDNVTGLIWELKTSSGFRSLNDTYSWYDALISVGSPGTPDGGTCYTAGHCDTGTYRVDVNAAGLCGNNDWRIPTLRELQSIVDYGRSGFSIDPNYFPDMPYVSDAYFWTGSLYGFSANYAWNVAFVYGQSAYDTRSSDHYVRLVRAGQ